MSEAKFTKGEWIKTRQFTLRIGGEESYLTTQQTGDYFASAEEREANARLIAAAPEMYEMLKKYVDLVSDDRSEDFLYEFQEIEVLLLKASGES